MIKHYLITGDTHGQCVRFGAIDRAQYPPEETAIIVLGDGGNNYYLDDRDVRLKRTLLRLGYTFYFVRGNHEARPEDISTMELVFDDAVNGLIYYEPDYPNIHYFFDGGEYKINGRTILVIGGAYSVDKQYRLARGWQWFYNEQLNDEERTFISNKVKGNHYDIVLTHTSPYSWEPREMFLPYIDQSSVDDSTERWLEEIKDSITFDFWLFGHFHGDKIVSNNSAMLYEQVINFDMINPIDEYTEIPEGFRI